jgi:hypothetical protein
MCECGIKLEFNDGFAQCKACGKEYEMMNGNKVKRDEELVIGTTINKKFKNEKY